MKTFDQPKKKYNNRTGKSSISLFSNFVSRNTVASRDRDRILTYQVDHTLDPALQRGRAAVDAVEHVLVLCEERVQRRRRRRSGRAGSPSSLRQYLTQLCQGASESLKLSGHLLHLVRQVAPVLQNLERHANGAFVDVDGEDSVGLRSCQLCWLGRRGI